MTPETAATGAWTSTAGAVIAMCVTEPLVRRVTALADSFAVS